MTNGGTTTNLLALLHLQQQRGMQVIQQQQAMNMGGLMTMTSPGIMGLPGMVGHALPRSVMPPPELVALMMSTFTPRPEEASCCIYVGNLVASINGDQLKQFFGASCGHVENVRVATEQEVTLAFRQANTGQTFAFVQFEQQESATTALTLSGMQLGDKPIKVFPAKLPPALIAHGGKGGDLGAMQKAMDVQARLAKRMEERKAKEEAAAAEKAAKEAAKAAREAEREARKAAGCKY